MTVCSICGKEFDEALAPDSIFHEAGAWLSEEVWQDSGAVCPQCLENRARLVMMYAHEHNR